MTEQDVEIIEESTDEETSANKRVRRIAWIVIGVVVAFLLGFGSGYLKWGQDETADWKQQKELAQLSEQVNPKGWLCFACFLWRPWSAVDRGGCH